MSEAAYRRWPEMTVEDLVSLVRKACNVSPGDRDISPKSHDDVGFVRTWIRWADGDPDENNVQNFIDTWNRTR